MTLNFIAFTGMTTRKQCYGNCCNTQSTMATPNYSFEKRKREQAQKAAKEAKRLRKAAAKTAAADAPVVTDEPVADTESVS